MSFATKLARGFAIAGLPLGSFMHGVKAGLTGAWEGSERTRQRRRPGRDTSSQDNQLNYGVREDMLSEARNLTQTFSLARYIARKYANHVVGSCRMKWQTGDPAIDKIYRDAWQSWMPMADLSGRHNFKKMTKIAVESILRDGRIVGQKDTRGGFLQINPIEGDRITSDGLINVDRPGMVGGFGLDANGRITFARVWERTIYGYFQNPKEIPAKELVHAFDSSRFDAVTGVTHFAPVLNTVRDFKETGLAERLAAKRNSKLALLVKTMSGGAGTPGVDLFSNADPSAGGTDKVNVQEVNDVADAFMFPNEDMKAHTSDRPSEGWRWLMEMQVREIAMAFDLPFGVVWHMAGLGGPAARFEIAQANRVFCALLEDVIEPMWIRPIVGSWLTVELQQGRLPFHPRWYCFKTPRPASITIDLGRESQAGINENLAGLTTATDWYAELDEDFEEKTDLLGYEAGYRRKVARANQVPVEELRLLTQQGNPGKMLEEPGAAAVREPLNGAQITAALEVMLKLREQALTVESGAELLVQIGIERTKAVSMVRNIPKLDTGAGDVSFKREVLTALLAVPAAREAVYNSMDIEDLVSATGLPPEKNYQAPWIPVVAAPGPEVDGGITKDADGDIVGGTAKQEKPLPVKP